MPRRKVMPEPERSEQAEPPNTLPQDVQQWLRTHLQPGERVAASLLADISPTGAFCEQWVFLTDRRLFTLQPNGKPDAADLLFDMPLEKVEGAQLRNYVASGSLIVRDRKRGHEVCRFSLGSRQEASAICHCLKEVAERRKKDRTASVAPPPPRREGHRCSNCGRALRRHGEVCRHCMDRRLLVVRLFSFVLPYKWIAASALGLTLAVTALQLVPPYLTKVLVDDVITPQPPNMALLPVVIFLLIIAYVGQAVVGVFRFYAMRWLGNRVLFDLRVTVYEHIQLLRLAYYNQRQTGQIMARVTNDLTRLQNFIAEGFQEFVVNILTMLLIAVILATMDFPLFLVVLTPIPVIAVTTYLFGRRIHLLYHRIWRRVGAVSAVLADTIPGIRVVKSFAQERRESRRFTRQSADLFRQELRVAKMSSLFFPFLQMMTGLGAVLIFSVGSYRVIHGYTTLGVLIAFTSYMWRFYMPVQRFGEMNHRLQHCLTSAERVFEILDTDVEPTERPGGVVLKPLKGAVEFRDVQFSYEPGKFALDGISFRVEPGEMIGLVGPSGAGKSTLVHLIARFYEVDDGEILIDGHNVLDLALRPYRQQIGVVLQEPYLFHGTIWSNIAYANPDASADEIIAAARAANAHEFILDLPDGYDTVIGERGQTLSGGERQRLSIARAVLRDPRILILDEATASVDTETESMIQKALERLVQNRTTFAIAHRLSTLRKADRLIVLEHGRIVEIGTHAELIQSDGLYSRLCRLQSEMSKMRAW